MHPFGASPKHARFLRYGGPERWNRTVRPLHRPLPRRPTICRRDVNRTAAGPLQRSPMSPWHDVDAGSRTGSWRGRSAWPQTGCLQLPNLDDAWIARRVVMWRRAMLPVPVPLESTCRRQAQLASTAPSCGRIITDAAAKHPASERWRRPCRCARCERAEHRTPHRRLHQAHRFAARRFGQSPMRRGNMCRRIRSHAPATGVSMSANMRTANARSFSQTGTPPLAIRRSRWISSARSCPARIPPGPSRARRRPPAAPRVAALFVDRRRNLTPQNQGTSTG